MSNRSGEANLVYGMQGGRIVHINAVPNGLACNCVCPKCGEKLVARKGNIRVWHFGHISGFDCDTSGFNGETAPETALHKLAKQWLKDRSTIDLPPVGLFYHGKNVTLKKRETVKVINAKCEQSFGTVTPDVCMQLSDGSDLFLEVYVTHAVDDDKKAKLSDIGIATMEIDLSGVDRGIMPDMLDSVMLKAVATAVWSYHPDIETYIAVCEEKAKQKAEERREKQKLAAAARKARRKEINKMIDAKLKASLAPESKTGSAQNQDSETEAKRVALAAVYARIEADQKAREEAERQARIDAAERNRAEYLSKDAVGRLLHNPRCFACYGCLVRTHERDDPEHDLYACDACGRCWYPDIQKFTFDLVDDVRRCPDCGARMVKRRGPRGYFYGCSNFPSCRRTAQI